MRKLLQLSVIAVLLPAGCVTESDAPHLYTGMSRGRLRARFGEPHRVEHAPAGGEDWYYAFSNPFQIQGSRDHDAQTAADSASAGISYSVGADPQERPVHLSPEGYVIEPLPSGHLVR
jgi:hypothetical protein